MLQLHFLTLQTSPFALHLKRRHDSLPGSPLPPLFAYPWTARKITELHSLLCIPPVMFLTLTSHFCNLLSLINDRSVWWNKWNQMFWRALQFGIRLRWGWSIKWPNYCLMVLSVTPVVAMHDCFIYLLEFLCCFINIFYRLLFSCCTFKVDPQIRNMLFLSVFHFRNSIFVFHLIMLLSMPTHIISIVCCRASWGACGWVCMRDWTARAKGLFESPKRDRSCFFHLDDFRLNGGTVQVSICRHPQRLFN